jgi:hypothetical protein
MRGCVFGALFGSGTSTRYLLYTLFEPKKVRRSSDEGSDRVGHLKSRDSVDIWTSGDLVMRRAAAGDVSQH